MSEELRTKVVSFAGILLLACGAASRADEQAPIKYPFVDWYGIWAGRVAIDENGDGIPFGDHLVKLRESAARPPLIVIHPVGGDLGVYRHLVDSLSPDQAVYGLQSRLVSDAGREYASFDEMAARYVDALVEAFCHSISRRALTTVP